MSAHTRVIAPNDTVSEWAVQYALHSYHEQSWAPLVQIIAMITRMARRTTIPLEPGEHSIDRVQPRKASSGSWILDWRGRLHDGTVVQRKTRGRTIAQTRTKAKATFQELLTTGPGATWKSSDRLENYIRMVSRPTITNAVLRPATITRYLDALDQLLGECGSPEHDHAGPVHQPIARATRFAALEPWLQEIAKAHGAGSARHCRAVLSKYVLQPLVRDGVIPANPLRGERITYDRSVTTKRRTRGGVAISAEDHEKLLRHLLALDPATTAPPKRGRIPHAALIAKTQNVRVITLIQMTTGLRIGEVRTLTWDRVVRHGDLTICEITAELSKTHTARSVPIIDQRVADLLEHLRASSNGCSLIVGSPTAPSHVWDKDNVSKAIATAYTQWSKDLEIPELATARSHVWRATLNTRLITVPEQIRTTFFGHTAAVNRSHYTDAGSFAPLLVAAYRDSVRVSKSST